LGSPSYRWSKAKPQDQPPVVVNRRRIAASGTDHLPDSLDLAHPEWDREVRPHRFTTPESECAVNTNCAPVSAN